MISSSACSLNIRDSTRLASIIVIRKLVDRPGKRNNRLIQPMNVGHTIWRSISRCLGLSALWLFWPIINFAQTANYEAISATRLQSLTRAEVAGGFHFRIKGTVLCYDEGWHHLYIRDGQGTAYVSPQDSTKAFRSGQTVDVTGTALGDNTFTNLNFTILGEHALPAPKQLSLSQLAADHGQWIETSGRVLSGETSRGRLALLLHDQRQNCLVYV